MIWKIVLTKTALKSFKKIQRTDQKRIRNTIGEMETNPFTGDIRLLKGSTEKRYRCRVGSWRIFYTVDTEIRIVDIVDIKRRSSNTYS